MYMHLICTHKSRKSTSYGIVLMLHHHVMAIVKNVKKIRFLYLELFNTQTFATVAIHNKHDKKISIIATFMIVQKLSEYLQFSNHNKVWK